MAGFVISRREPLILFGVSEILSFDVPKSVRTLGVNRARQTCSYKPQGLGFRV